MFRSTNSRTQRNLSNLFCVLVFENWTFEQRIVGGKPGRVPWQVAILVRDKSGADVNDLQCGGSILDETHIMTAAHCTSPPPGQQPLDFDVRNKHHIVFCVFVL